MMQLQVDCNMETIKTNTPC